MTVNISDCDVKTKVVYFPNTSHTELDARVTRLFEKATLWTRFQKGTTAMRKFLPRMRCIVATAFKNQPPLTEDREFVLLYTVDKSLTLADKVEHECFTLLPNSYKNQYFKVAFDIYVEGAKKWMDNVRAIIAKELAQLSDGTPAFDSLSNYVQDQLKSFSIAPHVETVGFSNEEFQQVQYMWLNNLELRMARPHPLNWIIGNLTLDTWLEMNPQNQIKNLILGFKKMFFYGKDCESSKDEYERLQAKHGSLWKAYCDALENLSIEKRMEFAKRILGYLEEESDDKVVFEALCDLFPDETHELKGLVAKPLKIFVDDIAFKSPDLFF